MFIRKKKETSTILYKKVEHLVHTIMRMRELAPICGCTVRYQGRDPITNCTTVVYLRHRFSGLNEVKAFIHYLCFGQEHELISGFIKRAKEKVTDAYACEIEVSGYDADGDSISYRLNFTDGTEMLDFMENGIFSLDNHKHHQYKLLEE